MSAKHTPGPWRVDGQDLFQGVGHDKALMHAVIRDDNERWTALVEIEDKEGLENARLIASAPELLAALEALLEQADLGEVDEETKPIVDQARAAINKARGIR